MSFQVVGEREVPEPNIPIKDRLGPIATPAPQDEARNRKVANAAAEGVMLALKALSQRAVAGLSAVFTGAGLLVGYLLWDKIIAAPTPTQLGALGLYGAFFLALEWIRRR